MIDLSDLGIKPATSASTNGTATVVEGAYEPDAVKRRTLVPGSVLARALYSAWGGEPVTIVDSAPGSGKTTLLVDLVETLLNRGSGLSIVCATPTRRGAADLAERIAAAIDENYDERLGKDMKPRVDFSVKNYLPYPEGCSRGSVPEGCPSVKVTTVASCAIASPGCDIMVFDEGYQTTFSDMMSAADAAKQIVIVGDPGQIGPVVTTSTDIWDGLPDAPHVRGPEVLARRDDATVLRLDATYRLGQQTVDAIAPLYDFPFVSKRPVRHLVNTDGVRLPELDHVHLTSETSRADIEAMKYISALASRFVGSKVVQTDEDGNEETVHVTESDVAVVVPHNNQQTAIRAILDTNGFDAITVGTADSLQGGQWHAVVALDPVVGHTSLSGHQLSEGRLCVMASRHMTHLTWVSVPDWEKRFSAYADEHPREVANGIAVRRALNAIPD